MQGAWIPGQETRSHTLQWRSKNLHATTKTWCSQINKQTLKKKKKKKKSTVQRNFLSKKINKKLKNYISCILGRFFTTEPPGKPKNVWTLPHILNGKQAKLPPVYSH